MMPDLTLAEMSAIFNAANRTVSHEYADLGLICTQGQVPLGLTGILCRNGPGRLERGGQAYGHLFDGDGHLVQLALWEGGLPHHIDPETLETLGEEDFGGRLRNRYSWIGRHLAAVLPFSAHPCLDHETGDLYNFGLLLGYQHRLLLYRLGANGVLSEPSLYPLDRLSFVHSFMLTRSYWVFLLPQVSFDVPRSMLGLSTWASALRMTTDQPMEILLIPRDGGPARTFQGIPGFVFHIAHGYDQPDGHLVLDTVHYPDYPPLDRPEILLAPENPFAPPQLRRLILDPTAGTCGSHRLSDCPAELPTVAPGGFDRPRRYIFSIGAPAGRGVYYLSCIQRVDTMTGETIQHEFSPDLPGEPILVLEDSEESGWILTLVYRAQDHRTDLVILRSENLEIQAVLPLPHSLPPGFHGSWAKQSSVYHP